MSTTVDNQCTITGGLLTCPADTILTFGTGNKVLDAEITCPLNSVDQSQFRDMSQKGLCDCNAQILGFDGELESALDCECYVCPEGTRLGFGYVCKEPIFNDCYSYNCDFECNGEDINTQDIQNQIADTPAPAPVDDTSAAAGLRNTPVSMGALLLVWIFLRR